jgi:hypothetical protein
MRQFHAKSGSALRIDCTASRPLRPVATTSTSGKSRGIGGCGSPEGHKEPGVVFRPSSGRRGNVKYLARAHFCECLPQLHADGAVIGDLILGYMNDDNANSKLRDILLEFDTAIVRNEKIELLLRDSEKRTVFHGAPTSILDCRDLMAAEELLDSGVYAFVNEDAHSKICVLARSSTARTCCRVMDG